MPETIAALAKGASSHTLGTWTVMEFMALHSKSVTMLPMRTAAT